MNEQEYYLDWLESNEEELFMLWTEELEYDDAPDYVFEGVLDDDYEDAFMTWLETLEWKDVPDEWLQEQYERYVEDR